MSVGIPPGLCTLVPDQGGLGGGGGRGERRGEGGGGL